jgi:4a-hydroxytetrahydrobiopterin dehydratase
MGQTQHKHDEVYSDEEVIMWRPGLEAGALEDTPDDPRFKYIKY